MAHMEMIVAFEKFHLDEQTMRKYQMHPQLMTGKYNSPDWHTSGITSYQWRFTSGKKMTLRGPLLTFAHTFSSIFFLHQIILSDFERQQVIR